MNPATLSQIQFATTSIYHFFFVPLTLGLSLLVAIMETMYVRTGQDVYKRMTKFWGKLFLINFAMGVVTGIVQEFQFGMNWAEYSRFVGDVFGAPLAIEALLAFFLESTFLGIWIFGWERISKKLHLTAIWLVAFGSNLSALWILIANSFMQHPVGFTLENGRAVMNDFFALVTNPYVWGQFPHTITSGFTTGAFFVMGISAYHLLRKNEVDLFTRSFKISALVGLVGILAVMLVGHNQMQKMVQYQPMKFAAAEALVDSQDSAGLSVFSLVDQDDLEEHTAIRVPGMVSFLLFYNINGRVEGLRDLQEDFEDKYGPGMYYPDIATSYWSFRVMVGLGMLMLLLLLYALIVGVSKKPLTTTRFLWAFPFAILIPFLTNIAGWVLTEMGRQPWVVYGYLKTVDAVSPNVTPGMVLTSLIALTLVYGVLMAADIFLLVKFAKAGPVDEVQFAEAEA